MGLERQDDPVIVHGTDRLDGGSQLTGMVGIVVINIGTVKLSLEFQAASCAVEGSKAPGRDLTGNAQHPGRTGSSQGIDGIVLTHNPRFRWQ